MEHIEIVILAGGKGTRMQSELPKALIQLSGKPFLRHSIDTLERVSASFKPVVVVGYKRELIEEMFKDECTYVEQVEISGTATAVKTALPVLKNETTGVIVLYADHPLISDQTITKLITRFEETHAPIVMATAVLPDFDDWRNGFYANFSRIIRNSKGEMIRSVEVKDATDEEKKILEVNPCYFIFDVAWLGEHILEIGNDNAKGEYYLTDLIKIAGSRGDTIETVELDPHEALGANSLEELALLERLYKERQK